MVRGLGGILQHGADSAAQCNERQLAWNNKGEAQDGKLKRDGQIL